MKNAFKKILAVMVMSSLLLLAACSETDGGSSLESSEQAANASSKEVPEELSSAEIYDNAIKTMEAVTTFDANVLTKTKMSSADTNMEIDVDMQVRFDMREEGKLKMSSIGTTDARVPDIETYYLDGYSYVNQYGNKTKTPIALEEIIKSLPNSSNMINSNHLEELTTKAGDDGSVEISYSAKPESLQEILNSSLSNIGYAADGAGEMIVNSSVGTMKLDSEGSMLSHTNTMIVEMPNGDEKMTIEIYTETVYNSINEDITIQYPADLDSYLDLSA